MSRNGAWKLSTCLAAGVTALALAVVSAPALAAGHGRGAEGARSVGRGGSDAGVHGLGFTAARLSVRNVSASSFIDPTGMSEHSAAGAQQAIRDPMIPQTSSGFENRNAAAETRQPSAAGGQQVIRDPILPQTSFRSGNGNTAAVGTRQPAAAGDRQVIRDPILPQTSFRSGNGNTADAGTQRPSAAGGQHVIRDPILPQASTEVPGPSTK